MQSDAYNHIIRRIVLSSSLVSTLAGASGATGSMNGIGTAASFHTPYGITIDAAGTVALVVSGVRNDVRAEVEFILFYFYCGSQ